MHLQLEKIQSYLRAQSYSGWLIYDYRKNNPYAVEMLSLQERHPSRRLLYWITAEGWPIKVIHSIERHILEHLPGKEITYRNQQEFREALSLLLTGPKKILMEYVPFQEIPAVSIVDAGLMDCVRACGVEVASSADLLTMSIATLSQEQVHSHREAAAFLEKLFEQTWKKIRKGIDSRTFLNEYAVQQGMLESIEEAGFETDHPPICAVNAHSANPHYAPSEKTASPIKEGDWVLLDVWCKKKGQRSVYADITRVGIAGNQPSEEQLAVHKAVRKAQVAAIEFLRKSLAAGKKVEGWQVDHAARQILEQRGLLPFAMHRTGHNIYTELHGPGAHFDDFETRDTRSIFPSTCYSVEPGIYLPAKFGIRLETDIFVDASFHVHVTGGEQDLPKIF